MAFETDRHLPIIQRRIRGDQKYLDGIIRQRGQYNNILLAEAILLSKSRNIKTLSIFWRDWS